MATGLGVGLSELKRGRTHYIQHCAQCHPRVAPGTTDPEFWREITPRMASYAQLTESGERELLIYVMGAHGAVHGANLKH